MVDVGSSCLRAGGAGNIALDVATAAEIGAWPWAHDRLGLTAVLVILAHGRIGPRASRGGLGHRRRVVEGCYAD